MAERSAIEWTDATWNPIAGCSVVSPGCTNCYAMRMAARLEAVSVAHEARHGGDPGPLGYYRGLTEPSRAGDVWTGKVVAAPDDVLTKPLRWRKPRRIFVNSMSDLFHEDVPDAWIDRVFAVAALSARHQLQVLTKRLGRMRDYLSSPNREVAVMRAAYDIRRREGACGLEYIDWPLPNVWLGVSVEDQRRADERIPELLATPAAVRWVSAEPLLGPVDLSPFLFIVTHADDAALACGCSDEPLPFNDPATTDPADIATPRLDWVVAGGESGPGARPMHPDWARALRDQCAAAAVPFLFKQWGEWAPHRPQPGGDLGGDVRAGRVQIVHPSGRSHVEVSQATGGRSTEPGSRYMALVGKAAAGRLLDGVLHDGFPVPSPRPSPPAPLPDGRGEKAGDHV